MRAVTVLGIAPAILVLLALYVVIGSDGEVTRTSADDAGCGPASVRF